MLDSLPVKFVVFEKLLSLDKPNFEFKKLYGDNTSTITDGHLRSIQNYNIWDFFIEPAKDATQPSNKINIYIFPPIVLLLLSVKIAPNFSKSNIGKKLVLTLNTYDAKCHAYAKEITAPTVLKSELSLISKFGLGFDDVCTHIRAGTFDFRSFDKLIKAIKGSTIMHLFIKTNRSKVKFIIISKLAPYTAFAPIDVLDYIIETFLYRKKNCSIDRILLFKKKYKLYEDLCRNAYQNKNKTGSSYTGPGFTIPTKILTKINTEYQKIIKTQPKSGIEYDLSGVLIKE
jgi:hypothetical protein